MNIDLKFINPFQEKIFSEQKRNICGSGGFGNGKTTVFCQKILALCCAFPNYRAAIFRTEFRKLCVTTRVTFFKICPPELYDEALGGKRVDSQNYVRFINGSEIYWMHGDNTDDKMLMGLEVNSIFVDQAEELPESTYEVMDGRVGRWDMADVPSHMDKSKFPVNPVTKRLIVPNYMMLACNPDDTSHWIYQKYHKESYEHNIDRIDPVTTKGYRYSDTHIMYEAGSADNPALPEENKAALRRKGASYVRRFYYGQWGIFEGQVHKIDPLSIIENCPTDFYQRMLKEATLMRILDHGTSAPTCCIWAAIYKKWVILFREYYVPDARISEHRQGIADLSGEENYALSLADPAVYQKQSEKYGQAWCVADEYMDSRTDAPPIVFQAADNHELRTRNAIDEILAVDEKVTHPITGTSGAPRLYFLKRNSTLPNGCWHSISETQRQRREKLGVVDGEESYTDKRAKHIPDHAYDCVRYLAGYRIRHTPKKPPPKSIKGTFIEALRSAGVRGRFARGNGYGIRTF